MTDHTGINTGYDRPLTEDDTLFDHGPIVCPACRDRKPLHNERNDFRVGIVQSDGRCDRCTWSQR